MKIICHACKTDYQVPDDRIPASGARASCPNCGRQILIPPPQPSGPGPDSPWLVNSPGSRDFGQTMSYDYEAVAQDSAEISALLKEAARSQASLTPGCRYSLRETGGGKEYPLASAEITIGRSGTDVILADPEVSRRHAILKVLGDHALIIDQESTNGTYVGEKKILTSRIPPGGRFRVGNTVLEFFVRREG